MQDRSKIIAYEDEISNFVIEVELGTKDIEEKTFLSFEMLNQIIERQYADINEVNDEILEEVMKSNTRYK